MLLTQCNPVMAIYFEVIRSGKFLPFQSVLKSCDLGVTAMAMACLHVVVRIGVLLFFYFDQSTGVQKSTKEEMDDYYFLDSLELWCFKQLLIEWYCNNIAYSSAEPEKLHCYGTFFQGNTLTRVLTFNLTKFIQSLRAPLEFQERVVGAIIKQLP